MKTQTQDDGGPAFPQGHPEMAMIGQSLKETQGMTLRDVFAAVAMRAMISRGHDALNIGHKAYITADDMLDARNR